MRRSLTRGQSSKVNFIYLADSPEFVQTCARWSFEEWGKYNPAATLQKRIEDFQAHCNKDHIPISLLAVIDNHPVGMASLRANDGIRPDLTPWLGSLYVDAQFRGMGIGELLIAQIRTKTIALGYKELYLLTFEKSLPSWYSSIGWQEIGKDLLLNNPVTLMKITLVL
jgi:GNAT superfamily N-acetyltransferase